MKNENYRIIESSLYNDVFLVWDDKEENNFSIHKINAKGELIEGKYFNDFMKANLHYNQFRDKELTTEEFCSTCGANAKISYNFKIQRCNECGELIYPCSLCEQDYVNCFGECPLNKIKTYELETYRDKFNVLAEEVQEHFNTDIETFLLEYTYDDAERLADILNIKIVK